MGLCSNIDVGHDTSLILNSKLIQVADAETGLAERDSFSVPYPWQLQPNPEVNDTTSVAAAMHLNLATSGDGPLVCLLLNDPLPAWIIIRLRVPLRYGRSVRTGIAQIIKYETGFGD